LVARVGETAWRSNPAPAAKRAMGYELATDDYYEFAGFAGQVNVRIVGI
jgi:hypothetical protein